MLMLLRLILIKKLTDRFSFMIPQKKQTCKIKFEILLFFAAVNGKEIGVVDKKNSGRN